MKRFYSHGKLLLTGEYLVLDGALALAIPTRFGQSLTVKNGEHHRLKWTSYDADRSIWLDTEFTIDSNENLRHIGLKDSISERLLQILTTVKQLNPNFLNDSEGYYITTELEFPRNWGLGTSSTLINNIANWAKIDAYELLEATFGGSGYDIACAEAKKSLVYQINDKKPNIKSVNFDPEFKEQICFVHLNQKQNSRQGIIQYRNNTTDFSNSISEINTITKHMISCKTLQEFQKLLEHHEALISDIIKMEPVKKRLFPDFQGSIKSLGAWGGDFVMVASSSNPKVYFNEKGYKTILSYSEMVKT